MKNYYELLAVAPTAPADEVKRAFRAQISRYHPDKVQHLGQEFQAMAADRAAELTEAYRVLSDPDRRAEYDRQLSGGAAAGAPRPAAAPASRPEPSIRRPEPEPAAAPAPRRRTDDPIDRQRDAFVKRVVVGKLREALMNVLGPFEEPSVPGFDVVAVPRPKLFARASGPRLLGRVVPCVDRDAVADAWARAGRWKVPTKDEICVLLMGSSLAPAGELADAIARQRRQTRSGPKVTLIPVDARDWQAHVPTDAPPAARELLARLRQGR